MDKNKDYDVIVGKVPRKDKQGNDITGDKLGAGGRRRNDNTYSGVAYDLEIVGEDTRLVRNNDRGSTTKRYEDFSPGGQLLIDVADIIITKTVDCLTDKVISSFEQWLLDRKIKNNNKNKKVVSSTVKKTKAQQILEEQNKKRSSEIEVSNKSKSPSATIDFDKAYEQFTINMTSEEAQKELLDIFMLSVIRAKKVWKLSHANIIDADNLSGQFVEGKEMVARLSDPDVISNINMMIEMKPDLLEEWESIALSDILGRDLIVDEQYVPIDNNKFKEALAYIPSK